MTVISTIGVAPAFYSSAGMDGNFRSGFWLPEPTGAIPTIYSDARLDPTINDNTVTGASTKDGGENRGKKTPNSLYRREWYIGKDWGVICAPLWERGSLPRNGERIYGMLRGALRDLRGLKGHLIYLYGHPKPELKGTPNIH